MSRPLSFVRLDIARFGIEISDRPDDKTLADWVRKFHRSLALQDPSICGFGSKLLGECAEFRAFDANRKRIPKDSSGIQRNPTESTTDHSIAYHSRADKEQGADITAPDISVKDKPKKKEFSQESIEMEAAKFFWQYLHDWSPSAKEPTNSIYQSWAKEFDLIMRIDHRSISDINELLDWINSRKESSAGFSWRKAIHSPGTLRLRWNQGKFADFLPKSLSKDEYK